MLDLRDFQYQRKYSDEYITNLIDNEAYVPIASGSELNALRTSTTQKMGAGTQWENDYATGIDKKYIQVRNITLIDYQAGTGWNPITANDVNFVYKGNLLEITKCKINNPTASNQALFGGGINQRGTYEDIILEDFDIIGLNAVAGLVTYFMANIKNCHIRNSRIEGKGSSAGALFEQHRGGDYLISDCSSQNNIIINQTVGAFGSVGGMCGTVVNSTNNTELILQRLSSFNNYVYSLTNYAGGISGYVDNLAATRKITFKNCKSEANNIIATSFSAGLIARLVRGGETVENCFSNSKVTGTSNTGGLVGQNTGTITNSFFDSETSGQSDANGSKRTTLQMLNGTADSFILANGDIDPDELAANAMYTAWDESIWRFHNNKYPKIKRI